MLDMSNLSQSIHSCLICMNIKIASVILEICIVSEPETTSGPGLILAHDTGTPCDTFTVLFNCKIKNIFDGFVNMCARFIAVLWQIICDSFCSLPGWVYF